MYNLFFCLDRNYLELIYNVFTTFIKIHDPKKFNLNFVIYDPDNNLDCKIKEVLLKISTDFNITCKYFIPTDELKKNIIKYSYLLFGNNEEKKSKRVYFKLPNWSRFYISKLFPDIKTGLYLDLDILFNKNIEGIFKTDISNSIVAVSPYNKGNKSIFKKMTSLYPKDKPDILNKFLTTFEINIKDLDNLHYNCGVMYFNFELYKKEKILEKIIILLKYLVNVHKFIHGGTEKIQNVLIPNYNTFSVEYNSIFKYRKVDLNKNIIIHFKGKFNLLKYNKYQNVYDQIIKK